MGVLSGNIADIYINNFGLNLKVVSPEGSDLVLATYIPHSKANVFVFHCLHIETCSFIRFISRKIKSLLVTYSGDGGDNFTKFQLV